MSVKSNVFHLTVDLFRVHPTRALVIIFSLLLSGLSEGIGLMALLPLLGLVTDNVPGSTSTLNRWMSVGFSYFGYQPTITGILLIIVVGIGLKGLFGLISMWEVGYAVSHITSELRLSFLRALFDARWRYFTSKPVGSLVNALSSEAARAALVYTSVAELLSLTIQVIVGAILVFASSWKIALTGLIGGLSFTFLFKSLIQSTRQAGRRQTDLLNSLSSILADVLQGIKPIKAMGAEKNLLVLLENQTMGMNKAQQSQIWNNGLLANLQEPLLAVMMGLCLYIGLVHYHLSFGIIMIPAFLFYRLLNRIHSIQKTYQTIVGGESAYISIQTAIKQAESEKELSAESTSRVKDFHDIEFREVSFSYGNKRVLNRLSLSMTKGNFVAIVGLSGAGKTTLADLVVRLSEPDSGQILVDGQPLQHQSLRSWRELVGYVPQEILLFHDSIFNNLSLGDPAITRETAEQALRLADAWRFVALLPEKLDTVVGERGSKLSRGQRQRISLARALVRQPKLLILDEVTTSLDPETEKSICETLTVLKQSRTILAISHQVALMQAADCVYELAEGRLKNISPLRQS